MRDFMNENEYNDFLNINGFIEQDGNILDKSTHITITTKEEFIPYFSKYGDLRKN